MLLQIPPGTSSHAELLLRGKGIKKRDSYGYGDHILHVRVSVPKKLSNQQEALLRAFAELDGDCTQGSVNGSGT